jgi:hypothetical protein
MSVEITEKSTPQSILSKILKIDPIPRQTIKNINPSEAVIILQREYAIFYATAESKQKKSSSQVRYIGTKRLASCIFVFLSNREEYFAAHIDITRSIDFAEIIQSFKSKDNLSVTLIGGYSNDRTSVANIQFILDELINVSKQFKTKITISAQKILSHNDYTEKDSNLFVYNKLIEKADILHRYLYGEALDICHVQGQVADLSKEKPFNQQAQFFNGVLLIGSAVMANPMFTTFLGLISGIKDNKTKFYELLNQQFCTTYRDMVLQADKLRSIHPSSSLDNFLLDMQTGQVFPMYACVKTTDETIRHARVSVDNYKLTKYMLIYQHNQYTTPSFSDSCLEMVKKYIVKDSKAPPRKISESDIDAYLKKVRIVGLKFHIARDILNFIQDCPQLFFKTELTYGFRESKEGKSFVFFKFPKSEYGDAIGKFQEFYKYFLNKGLYISEKNDVYTLNVQLELLPGLIKSMLKKPQFPSDEQMATLSMK